MMLTIELEDNKYLQRFFRKYAQYEAAVKHNVHTVLPEIILHRPHKIKPAYDLKRHQLTIQEYKVVVDKVNFRAAYTQSGDVVTVFYITPTTIKREFVRELASTSLCD